MLISLPNWQVPRNRRQDCLCDDLAVLVGEPVVEHDVRGGLSRVERTKLFRYPLYLSAAVMSIAFIKARNMTVIYASFRKTTRALIGKSDQPQP